MTLVYQHELPNVPGKSIKGVFVDLARRLLARPHASQSAFIYATVLEGAMRSQVNDGPVTTYKAGQSFSEMPGDRHGVTPMPARRTVQAARVLVVDTNETELTTPLGNSARLASCVPGAATMATRSIRRAVRHILVALAFALSASGLPRTLRISLPTGPN